MNRYLALGLVITAQLGNVVIAQGRTEAEIKAEEAEVGLKLKYEDLEQKEIATDKAQLELQVAKSKSLTDALPTTSATGKVDVKTDAGKMEASALTAVALNDLARGIARDVRKAAVYSSDNIVPVEDSSRCTLFAAAPAAPPATDPAPILLLMGEQTLTFAHWDQFRARACELYKRFVDANREASGFAPVEATATQAVGSAQAALAVGSKLLQLFQTDWEVGGINATATDRALASAVARAYLDINERPRARIYWGSQVSKLGGSAPVFSALGKLDDQDAEAAKAIARIKVRVKKDQATYDTLSKVAKPTKWQKARLDEVKPTIEKAAKLTTALTEAKAAYATLVKSMAGKEGETGLPINSVINEAAAGRLLGQNGMALSLDVETSGGGYYTTRSFWTSLGLTGLPHRVSGGAVVSYLAVRPTDQQVMAAGLFTCNAGYVKLTEAAWRTNGAAAGLIAACPTSRSRRP